MCRIWKIALAALAVVWASAAASAPNLGEISPLFASHEPLRLTVRAPLGRLASDRDAAEPFDGTLTVAGSGETLPIKLEARGITRRSRDICQFPPLRIEFAPKPPEGSLFRDQKRLKLVTHCRSSESFQQHVLLEYAAYRMYNLLTPLSFAVRLATIDYLEADGEPKTSRLAFFIEDTDDAAKRNGLREANMPDLIPSSTLSPADAGRYAMFQYMIGNLDWAIVAGPPGAGCCHNSKLVGPAGATAALVPIPYDFDFSGLVDAPYATPPDSVPVGNVRVRRYRGYCKHNAQAGAAAAAMLPRRAALLAVLDELPQLTPRTRAKATDYLDGFFAQIDTPTDVPKVLRTCL